MGPPGAGAKGVHILTPRLGETQGLACLCCAFDVVNLRRQIEERVAREFSGLPGGKAWQDRHDSSHRIGNASRHGEPLDHRIEKRVSGGDSIALSLARLFHRLEQEERPQSDVVERSASTRGPAIHLTQKLPNPGCGSYALVVVEEARKLVHA